MSREEKLYLTNETIYLIDKLGQITRGKSSKELWKIMEYVYQVDVREFPIKKEITIVTTQE